MDILEIEDADHLAVMDELENIKDEATWTTPEKLGHSSSSTLMTEVYQTLNAFDYTDAEKLQWLRQVSQRALIVSHS